jgi:hypothetical protein
MSEPEPTGENVIVVHRPPVVVIVLLSIILGVVLTLGGVFGILVLNNASNARSAADKATQAAKDARRLTARVDANAARVRRNQTTSCLSGDVLGAYLQKRAKTLRGSEDSDLQVLLRGRPILDCAEKRKPLSRHQQALYVKTLFRCRCEPVIDRGRVIGTRSFRPLPKNP